MAVAVNWFIPVNHRVYNRMQASIWIRCLQLIPYLEAEGIRCCVNEPDTDTDITVFVRWQDGHAYHLAKQQKQKGNRIIFDLCVNYFDETGIFENGYGTTRERYKEAIRMVEVADVVTCASDFIAQRARQFHDKVAYLPDSIDRRHFCYTKPVEGFYGPKLHAIWSGISIKTLELEPILPLLRRRGVEVIFISDRRPGRRIPGWIWKLRHPHRFVKWNYETFPQHMLEGEICLSHRPVDDPYNRGHSFFKIGVFMAQGIPAIAAPVPSYKEILKNGEGGRLCYTMEEYEEALDEVIGNRDLLVKWSEQARLAMRPYLTETIAQKYKRLFNSLRREGGS